jgi:N-acetylated-alpha-linked acidic dipeptidase
MILNCVYESRASRAYTAKPHLAGSQYDLDSAIVQLRLLQSSFSIPSSSPLPIYDAGSSSSRSATLSISSPNLSSPNAWIDTYYPVLNTPLERAVEILDEDGQVVWRADLEEVEDEEDEGSKWAREVPAFHGLSAEGDVTVSLFLSLSLYCF